MAAVADPRFRRDLYRGTARYYDRFRRPYPAELTGDLVRRCRADGEGRLADLACGTGQLAFALRRGFAEVWAVDREPGMVEVVREKASLAGVGGIRAVAADAEDADLPEASFDLIVIGNAFHRLDRRAVAANVFRWLRPGGHLALVWSDPPWLGDEPWQRALAALLDRWQVRAGAADRIPAGWDVGRAARPDAVVLAEAGLRPAGRREFPQRCEWTVAELAGLAYSTSFLSREALGDLAPDFEADLRAGLSSFAVAGPLAQRSHAAYELAFRRS